MSILINGIDLSRRKNNYSYGYGLKGGFKGYGHYGISKENN